MHHIKAFLITVVIVCFAAVGGAMLAGLGLIPQPIYSFLYDIEKSLGLGGESDVPSLQKFEGYWRVAFVPTIEESELGKCVHVEGNLRVHNGLFSGSIGPFGSSMGVRASTTENGTVSGVFSTAGIHRGTINGRLRDQFGTGTWVDNYECRGTIAFTKLEPVVDPVQGHITQFSGEVTLFRGGVPRWAVAGQPLYVGDRVEVGTNSEALVTMVQSGKTTVPAGAGFIVPEPIK